MRSGSATSRAARSCGRATGRRSCSCAARSRRRGTSPAAAGSSEAGAGTDVEPERGDAARARGGGSREGPGAGDGARARRRPLPEGVPAPPHRRRRTARVVGDRAAIALADAEVLAALPLDGAEPRARRADGHAAAAGADRLLHRVHRRGGDRVRRRRRRWRRGTGSSPATASTAPRCCAGCRSRRSCATSSGTPATS